MDPWFGYGVPALVVTMGMLGLAYARWMTRHFERKYGEWPTRPVPLRIVPAKRHARRDH